LGSSQISKQEGEEEGSHCQANLVAPDLQNRWHRFWAVCLFRCEGASPEIPEISTEIPDFPETLEKSLKYQRFTDKFVLSGDFQDSPIHPPLGDIKILSPINNTILGDIPRVASGISINFEDKILK
jgi:hypothetical protein